VAFIHQHENIGIGVGHPVLPFDRGKLVDDRGNDACFAFGDEPHQMFSGVGFFRCFSARPERAPNLVVQIDSVGHDDDTGVGNGGMQREGLGQHHHGQRLAAAGGMPDDAALPHAFAQGKNSFDGALDRIVLLIAGNFSDPGVKDDIAIR